MSQELVTRALKGEHLKQPDIIKEYFNPRSELAQFRAESAMKGIWHGVKKKVWKQTGRTFANIDRGTWGVISTEEEAAFYFDRAHATMKGYATNTHRAVQDMYNNHILNGNIKKELVEAPYVGGKELPGETNTGTNR